MKTKRNICLLALTATFALISSLVTVAQEDIKTETSAAMGAKKVIINNDTDNKIKMEITGNTGQRPQTVTIGAKVKGVELNAKESDLTYGTGKSTFKITLTNNEGEESASGVHKFEWIGNALKHEMVFRFRGAKNVRTILIGKLENGVMTLTLDTPKEGEGRSAESQDL